MKELGELRDLFVAKGFEIADYCGWYLVVGKDRYGLVDGKFYRNGVLTPEKELLAGKKKDEPVRVAKKIRSKNGTQSIETDER